MLVQCLLTAFSVTTSRWPIALLDRPSAISSSTWRSRSVSRATGGLTGPPGQEFRDDLGVHDRTAARHRAQRVGELLIGEHPVLEQVADPARLIGEQFTGVQPLDMRGEDQDGQPRHLAPGLERRPQALIGIGRREPDVDDGHVRPLAGQRPQQ